jgi:hypothetical protein
MRPSRLLHVSFQPVDSDYQAALAKDPGSAPYGVELGGVTVVGVAARVVVGAGVR